MTQYYYTPVYYCLFAVVLNFIVAVSGNQDDGNHGNSAIDEDEPKHIPLKLGVESEVQELPCLEWKYYAVEVTEPCEDLNVQVLHTGAQGEPNLYVSRGATKYPTDRHLTWTSYNWGSENLTISGWDPEFVIGTFYIGVHAYCGTDVQTGYQGTQYKVLVDSIPTTHPHEEIFLNDDVSDSLASGGYKYFRFCMPDNCANIEVKLENCVDPLACPDSYSWPELLVSRSIPRPTINDHSWKLASIDRRSVYIDHDDPEFYPGHYYVGVYGWCTPADFCADQATCGPCDFYPTNISVALIVEEVTSSQCKSKQPLGLCEGGDDDGSGGTMVVVQASLWIVAVLAAILFS